MHECCMGFVLGRKLEHETLYFSVVKWLQPAMKGTSVCAAVAAAVVPDAIGSSSVVCNEWLFLCAQFYAFLEAVVADRIGMAA